MKTFAYILSVLSALLLASCSDDDSFSIEIKAKGLESQGVTMTWIADGAVNTLESHANDDGKVKLSGTAREPALVEVSLSSSASPLALLIARNGDNIRVETSLASPLADAKVKGSKPSEALAAFFRDNSALVSSGDDKGINKAVSDFIIANPSSLASTALLVTQFSIEGNEHLADSLLNVLDPAVRPLNLIDNFNATLAWRNSDDTKTMLRTMTLHGAKDSLQTWSPTGQSYSLLAFTGRRHGASDSVERLLSGVAGKYRPKRMRVVEISLIPDSSTWRRRIPKNDTTGIERTWIQGAAAAVPIQRLNIVSTPYFIVSDSLGRQILRTSSATEASRFIKSKI